MKINAEQKIAGYSTKYRFTGKEVDEETGLYYFGARYAACPVCTAFGNPRISLWYGVDPLAEKYPKLNSYNYAENSPISLIDVWGTQGIPFSAASYIKTEVDKVVRAVETSLVKKADLVDNKVQELKQAVIQPIKDNADDLIETCEFLESSCSAIKDAALITTVASGGSTAPITLPLAGAAAASEVSMQMMKGAVNVVKGDKDGSNQFAKDIISETIETGLDKAAERLPMGSQATAATKYFIENIPGKVVDQVDKYVQKPKADKNYISKQKYELTVTDKQQN